MPEQDLATQIATLSQKVDFLSATIVDFKKSMENENKNTRDADYRVHQDLEERMRKVEEATIRIASNQTTLNLIQGAYTTLAAIAAAVLGRQ